MKAALCPRGMGYEPWTSWVSEALNEPRGATGPHAGDSYSLIDGHFWFPEISSKDIMMIPLSSVTN